MTDDEWLAALQGSEAKTTQNEWNEAQALRKAVLDLDADQPIDQLKKQRLIKEMRRLALLDTPSSNIASKNNAVVSRWRQHLPKPVAITSIAAGLAAVVFMAPYFGHSPEVQNPIDASGSEVQFRGRPVQLVFESPSPSTLVSKWQQQLSGKGIASNVAKNNEGTLLKVVIEKGALSLFLEWWNTDQARVASLPLVRDELPPAGQIWITIKPTE